MKTNDLRKGTRIQLRNGWFATLWDNARGNTRIANVEGIFTEAGSVYSHDIMRAQICGIWQEVQHTEKQLALRTKLQGMGF